MPKIDPEDHLSRPWRIHALAGDFELLDVWDYPITAGPDHDLEYFDAFVRRVEHSLTASGVAGLLFRSRAALGRMFGWDDKPEALPIPGCQETSMRDRLEPADRPGLDDGLTGPSPVEGLNFNPVYRFEEELLNEISNSTVHALMHVSWVERADGSFGPRMAVYVKPRGRAGRLYMALINPFRNYLVYPAMMRRLRTEWEDAHT